MLQCLAMIKKQIVQQNFEGALKRIDQIDGTDEDKALLQDFRQNVLDRNVRLSLRSVEKLQELILATEDGMI